jgi:hypothetical protein
MNWIFENLQVVIVLVVVAVTLVGKVLEAIRTNRPARGTTLEDIFGPDIEPGEAVPPPLRKLAGPPPLRQVTLPADSTAMEAELARQRAMQERLQKIRDAKSKATAVAAVATLPPTVVKRQTISLGLKGHLRSGKELRRAIITREILGPPVGLR